MICLVPSAWTTSIVETNPGSPSRIRDLGRLEDEVIEILDQDLEGVFFRVVVEAQEAGRRHLELVAQRRRHDFDGRGVRPVVAQEFAREALEVVLPLGARQLFGGTHAARMGTGAAAARLSRGIRGRNDRGNSDSSAPTFSAGALSPELNPWVTSSTAAT